jgi:hypothetical protein
MASPRKSVDLTTEPQSLEVFEHLKSMIICKQVFTPAYLLKSHQHSSANAKFLYGGSHSGRPRTYDVVTSSRVRSRSEFRVGLVCYDEVHKPATGKVDLDSKLISKSVVKLTLDAAMEDLLRKLQEELVWGRS